MTDYITPMLADRVDSRNGAKYLADDNWIAEQKFDGKRVAIHIFDGKVVSLNRGGQQCSFSVAVEKDFREALPTGNWVFDGELVGQTFHVFDMPRAGDKITPAVPLHLRRRVMEGFFERWDPPSRIKLVRAAVGTEEKKALLDALADSGAEGIILKRNEGVYRSGKRSETWRKYKFWQTADVFVTDIGVDGKSNARMGMVDLGRTGRDAILDVGTVSTLGKWVSQVEPGMVLEVRYLYAVDRNRPHLVQPNIMRIRSDKRPIECTVDQLHFTNKDAVV